MPAAVVAARYLPLAIIAFGDIYFVIFAFGDISFAILAYGDNCCAIFTLCLRVFVSSCSKNAISDAACDVSTPNYVSMWFGLIFSEKANLPIGKLCVLGI